MRWDGIDSYQMKAPMRTCRGNILQDIDGLRVCAADRLDRSSGSFDADWCIGSRLRWVWVSVRPRKALLQGWSDGALRGCDLFMSETIVYLDWPS